VVWGCVKVSPGCLHCYSEALAHRYQGGEFTAKRMAVMTPFLDEAELRKLLNPRALPPGSKVFIGDMTDICAPWVTDAMLDRLFATFALRPDVVFQLLTKRPGRMREYLNPTCPTSGRIWAQWMKMGRAKQIDADPTLSLSLPWPLPNVWLGTSVESQQWADMRIPELLETPAAVRFLSCEPLLGPIDIRQWLPVSMADPRHGRLYPHDAVTWVIAGGESGPRHRPMNPEWAVSIARQCTDAGVPVFFKQAGGPRPGTPSGDPWLDSLKQFPAVRS
jgi:protein gp37